MVLFAPFRKLFLKKCGENSDRTKVLEKFYKVYEGINFAFAKR